MSAAILIGGGAFTVGHIGAWAQRIDDSSQHVTTFHPIDGVARHRFVEVSSDVVPDPAGMANEDIFRVYRDQVTGEEIVCRDLACWISSSKPLPIAITTPMIPVVVAPPVSSCPPGKICTGETIKSNVQAKPAAAAPPAPKKRGLARLFSHDKD